MTVKRRLGALRAAPIIAACTIALSVTGCAADSVSRSASSGKSAASPSALAGGEHAQWLIAGPNYPLSAEQRATTNPAVTLANLQSAISVLESRASSGADATAAYQLSAALLQRAQILGRASDLDTAREWAELAVAEGASDPNAWLALAGAQAAVHRFEAATQSLAKAKSLGLAAEVSAGLERDIRVALGDYQALTDELRQAAQPVGDFAVLAHRADLLLLQGDLRGASLWLRTAQDFYHDVSPLPLAWLYSQQGIALLRFGHVAEARLFFAAAHQRLPTYYLATEHLAECEAKLGNLDRARELYAQVIEQTDNPEFMAALAELERRAGRSAQASDWAARADAGFRRLVQQDEAAYAAHAVDFWLNQPEANAEVLALARRNSERRADLASLILAVRAEFKWGQAGRGCALISRIDRLQLQPPEMQELEAFRSRCPAG